MLLIGSGANGKSVFLEVLAALAGKYSVAGVSPNNLDNEFHRAHLHGRLANIVTELPEGAVIDDAALKAITSGEVMTAAHKFRDPFDFRPYATCWFATNHMPHTRDFSDALFRRACVLTFNRRFEGVRKDPGLKDYLIQHELPGVLNLALAAIGEVLAGGPFAEPASMLQARNDWRLEADSVARFVDDRCTLDGQVESGVLYNRYKNWADDEGVRKPASHRSFTQRLQMRGVKTAKSGSRRMLRGIHATL